MTRCPRHDELLEADLDTLGGATDSDLAAHIRECRSCSRSAQEILRTTRALAAALHTAPTLPDTAAILSRARLGATVAAPPDTRTRVPVRRLGALAAAAALAALMVLGDRERASEPGLGSPPPPARQSLPVVEPESEQDVAIIPTGDPDITIVWIFQGD